MDIAPTTTELNHSPLPGADKLANAEQKFLVKKFINCIFSVHQDLAQLGSVTRPACERTDANKDIDSKIDVDSLKAKIDILARIDPSQRFYEEQSRELVPLLKKISHKDSPTLTKIVAKYKVRHGDSFHAVAREHQIEFESKTWNRLQSYLIEKVAFGAVLCDKTIPEVTRMYKLDDYCRNSLTYMVIVKLAADRVRKGEHWKMVEDEYGIGGMFANELKKIAASELGKNEKNYKNEANIPGIEEFNKP